MNQRYTLHYFDVRGRAEALRLLLAYGRIAYQDKGISGDEWGRTKADSPLGQMPFLVVHGPFGDRKIPQSMAIMRYLASSHGLAGKNEDERLNADVAAETAMDLRHAFSNLRYSPAWTDEAAREKFARESAPAHFKRLDKLLGDMAWFASSDPTYADFLVYDSLERQTDTWPKTLDAWPRLSAFQARVRALPQLSDYLGSRRPPAAP